MFLGCSSSETIETIAYESIEEDRRRADMLTILDAINDEKKDTYDVKSIASNLCEAKKIQHSSHQRFIDLDTAMDRIGENVRREKQKKQEDAQVIQEFRQNIQDLQNRVFELERKE